MATAINIGLSVDGIRDAVFKLNEYAADLQAKVSDFCLRLAYEGLGIANAVLARATNEMVEHPLFMAEAVLDSTGGVTGAALKVSGTQILFVEFSAGITFGTSFPQPLPSGRDYGDGMGMGTYPGMGHWDDPNGWWFLDPDNPEANERGYVHTYGNRAYQPMYHAEAAIIARVSTVAQAVFGS